MNWLMLFIVFAAFFVGVSVGWFANDTINMDFPLDNFTNEEEDDNE